MTGRANTPEAAGIAPKRVPSSSVRWGEVSARTVGKMSDIVLYETRGRIGLITLNRPEARNAVNGDVAAGVEAAIDQLEADPEVWVGILTANTDGQERPVFSAGADLKAIASGQASALNTKRGGFGGFVYRDRQKPVIVAVDGLATAGGCELVLAADLVVATTRSSFGLAEVKRNLIAGAGGLFRLPRAIGRAAAMEVILTGEPLSAQRAYDLGLVNRLVEPGQSVEEATRLAEQICAAAPLAVRASRKVVLASAYEDDETLKKMTNDAFAGIMASEDTKEGLTAFIEKRAPNWQAK
jgi:enoyl-CoA hydratase